MTLVGLRSKTSLDSRLGGMITSTIDVLILVPVFFAMIKGRAIRRAPGPGTNFDSPKGINGEKPGGWMDAIRYCFRGSEGGVVRRDVDVLAE